MSEVERSMGTDAAAAPWPDAPVVDGLAPGRSCAGCTFCCRLPEIDALSKPANMPCVHCADGRGCAIYDTRPALCRDFLCLWMTSDRLGREWYPPDAGMMIYRQGPQVTILVDPARPSAWKTEPQASALRRLAAEAHAAGDYVIVFVGDEVFKIEPVDE